MRSVCTWAAACALATAAPAALSAPILFGATATATASGPATSMLGAAAGYAAGPGSEVTVVTDSALDPEYISDDFALVVDIGSDGRLVFTDNTGVGEWTGRYEMEFSFAGAADFGGIVFDDLSALTSGSAVATLLSPSSFRIVLDGVQLSGGFASLGALISGPVAAVSVPGTFVLASLALVLVGLQRRGAAAS